MEPRDVCRNDPALRRCRGAAERSLIRSEHGTMIAVRRARFIVGICLGLAPFACMAQEEGASASGSTMMNALHQNNAVLVVSRSAIFNFNAGDYLEAMWATSSTSGSLQASAATAFAPAAPASTIAITRLHG